MKTKRTLAALAGLAFLALFTAEASAMYSPSTGRWAQRDPADYDGDGPNLYAYAKSGPISSTDPDGLMIRSFAANCTPKERGVITAADAAVMASLPGNIAFFGGPAFAGSLGGYMAANRRVLGVPPGQVARVRANIAAFGARMAADLTKLLAELARGIDACCPKNDARCLFREPGPKKDNGNPEYPAEPISPSDANRCPDSNRPPEDAAGPGTGKIVLAFIQRINVWPIRNITPSWYTRMVYFCPAYFNTQGPLGQAKTNTHEASHLFLNTDDLGLGWQRGGGMLNLNKPPMDAYFMQEFGVPGPNAALGRLLWGPMTIPGPAAPPAAPPAGK